MQRFAQLSILLLMSGLLLACQAPLTVEEQHATAVAGGCWPYGYEPPQPTRTPRVRYGTATPSPTPQPTGEVYPTCTPAPLTPTLTPRPTNTPTPRPPRTPAPVSVVQGPIEIGNQAGNAWLRTLAIHPTRRTAAVAWIANGSTFDDSQDGQVWARVQRADGEWSPLQTVNVGLIGKAPYAGLGLTIAHDGTISLIYGLGGKDGSDALQIVESRDDGATWSLPQGLPGVDAAAAPPEAQPSDPDATATPILANTPTPNPGDLPVDNDTSAAGEAQSGAVLALQADDQGGLHMLYRVRGASGKRIGYAYRAAGEMVWRVFEQFNGSVQYRGALGVLPQQNGRVGRFVAIQTEGAIAVYRSNDGLHWSRTPLPTGQYLSPETIFTMTMVVAPRGNGLVAVTWAQYSRGGVYAAVSLDGGQTWSQEERIAQHARDGQAHIDTSEGTSRSGYDPWVVYDSRSDQLLVSWTEMDRSKNPRTKTTVYAIRPLAEVTVPLWKYGISPDNINQGRPPTLGSRSWLSQIYGLPDGSAHFLLALDPNNAQQRVYVQEISVPGLIADGPS